MDDKLKNLIMKMTDSPVLITCSLELRWSVYDHPWCFNLIDYRRSYLIKIEVKFLSLHVIISWDMAPKFTS